MSVFDERVRHSLPPAIWPTVEEAGTSRLFLPGRIGPLATRTRTWVPAMVPWRASPDGYVTDDVLDWYGRFAEGAPGVLVVEATGVRDVPSGPLLRVGHDRFVPGLRRLVERVRSSSGGRTRLLLQILDFLRIHRRPDPLRFFERYLAIDEPRRRDLAERLSLDPETPEARVRSALASAGAAVWELVLTEREQEALRFGHRERVTDVHLDHIRSLPAVLPALFSSAAERALDAGFDGVELHFAHAYTMASFLSRRNTRDDGYGRDRDGRMRLALEVIAQVRARVGSACVGCRYLADEAILGGSDLSDAIAFGVAFAAAGLDFLSLSKGGKFEDARQPRIGEAAYPYTGPSGHECMPTITSDARGPFGRNVGLAAAVRAALRSAGHETPVVIAGGIATFELAESVLAQGAADFVGAARQSLADPDWWTKMETGRGAEIRRCSFTNYCEGLDQRHKEVTCRLWDKDFDPTDPTLRRSRDGRRRLVAPRWKGAP